MACVCRLALCVRMQVVCKGDLIVVNGGEWPGAHTMDLQARAVNPFRNGTGARNRLANARRRSCGNWPSTTIFYDLAKLGNSHYKVSLFQTIIIFA